MTNTQKLAAIRAIRKLLATPDRWTQGAMARDKRGDVELDISSKAVCWCLVGSIRYVCRTFTRRWTTYEFLAGLLGFEDIAEWQDAPERTHADILALLDRAESTLTEEHANG